MKIKETEKKTFFYKKKMREIFVNFLQLHFDDNNYGMRVRI